MVIGIGCDVVKTTRFKKWVTNKGLQRRYFTTQELLSLEGHSELFVMQRLAGMFSAKESFIKAVMQGVKLSDIIVERNKNGAPRLRLERSALKAFIQTGAKCSFVSISHEKNYSIAMVVLAC